MALTKSEADSVSSDYFDKTITPQVYEKCPLFWKLKDKKKVKWDGGANFQFPIRYTELSRAGAVGAREQVVYTQKETRTAGVLARKYYVSNAMIQWDEQETNTGKPKIISLIKDKTDEVTDDMYNTFASELYATTQKTKSFSSLDTIIDSTTTYAGIAVTDAAEWASTEDGTTTRLTDYGSNSLAYMLDETAFGTDGVDLIITTRHLLSKIKSLMEPQKRYTDDKMAAIGFNTVKFDGITCVSDYACPTGYLFGIDTDHMEWRYGDKTAFDITKWENLLVAGFPKALVKVVTWSGNLIQKMRKTCFKYEALDYTL